MTKQPTYEELAKRVRELENELQAIVTSDSNSAGSESVYRLMLESISDTVLVTDDHGNIVYVCPNTSNIFGLSQKDVYGFKTIQKLLGGTICDIKELKKEKEIRNIEWSIKGASGNSRFLLVNVKTVSINEGSVLYVMRDITERRKTEELLIENEDRYRTVLETINDGVVLQAASGEILTWNKGAEDIFGIPGEDALGQTSEGVDWPTIHENGSKYHGKDHPSMRTLETCKPCKNEIMGVYQPSGDLRWISINTNPLSSTDEKKPYAVAVSFSDITEFKKVENALRKNEAELRQTLDATTDGIWSWIFKTNELSFSPRYYTMLGYEPNEFPADYENWVKLIHPEDKDKTLAVAEEYMRTKPDVYENEFRLRTKDGEYRWIKTRARVVERDDNFDAVYMIGNHEDITERRKVEENLRAAKASIEWEHDILQAVMNGAKNIHLVYLDAEFNFVSVNQAYAESCGCRPDEMIGKNHFALYPHAENEAIFANVRDTGIPFEVKDKPFTFPDQPERGVTYWDWSLTPMKNCHGKVAGLVFSLVETTEHKRVEEALQKSEEEHRSILRTAMDGFWVASNNGAILEVNEAYCQMSGYTEEELLSMHISDLEGTESVEDIGAHMQKVIRHGGDRFESVHRRKDQTVFDVEVGVQHIAANSEDDRVFAFIRDISDQKHLTNSLRESEERYRRLTENSPAVVYQFKMNPKGEYTFPYLSEALTETMGLSPKEAMRDPSKVLEMIHPEDRESFRKNVRKSADSLEGYHEIFRCLKDGKIIWIEARSVPESLPDGSVIWDGFFIDVTRQKQAEEALRASEAEKDAILDASPDIILLVGTDFKIIWANRTAGETVNRDPQDLMGHACYEAFQNLDRPCSGCPTVAAIASGKPRQKTMYQPAMHGIGESYWEDYSMPIKDASGRIMGAVEIGRNITDRKRDEKILRESEDFLNRTGDMAKVGGWEVDLNTMKVIWTRTTGRIHELPDGYFPDLEEAIGYYHPEDQDHVRQCVQRAIESSEPFDFTVRLITAKGRERWVRALGQPIFDSGSCVRLSGTFQDITERLKLEEELRQSQKMEAIGTLAGGIAHEFNNVLGIIMGNAELALDDVPDWNPAKESLREIRKASFRAKEVVRQILSFARKTMTSINPLEINTIVKESLKFMRASIPAMVDIQPSIPSEPKTILGDPTEIHQVVINLCTNAAHAMKASGGILEVGISEVTLDERTASRYEDLSAGDFVKLTVKDSGEGISPNILGKVFEPYFTTKEFGAGSGMGLAVVYGIVKKCKGAINIISTVREGTTVEVLFPKIDEEAPAEEKKKDELPTGNERILLVDDDPSIVTMITQMLERLGYAVSSMTDSKQALEHFKSTPDDFELVFTDMAMPKMSGDALAAELIKVRKDIPILLCTGHSDTIDEKKAKKIGIKGFAMKPLDKRKLARAVRAALDDR